MDFKATASEPQGGTDHAALRVIHSLPSQLLHLISTPNRRASGHLPPAVTCLSSKRLPLPGALANGAKAETVPYQNASKHVKESSFLFPKKRLIKTV